MGLNSYFLHIVPNSWQNRDKLLTQLWLLISCLLLVHK